MNKSKKEKELRKNKKCSSKEKSENNRNNSKNIMHKLLIDKESLPITRHQ